MYTTLISFIISFIPYFSSFTKMKTSLLTSLLLLFLGLSLVFAHDQAINKEDSSSSSATVAGEHPEFFFPFFPHYPWAPWLHPHPYWPPNFPFVPPPMPANGGHFPHWHKWVPPPMPTGGDSKKPLFPWWWHWTHMTPPPLPAGAGSKLPPWWQHFKPPHAHQDYSAVFPASTAKESSAASNHA